MAPDAKPGPQTSPQRLREGEPPCGVDGTRRPTDRRRAHSRGWSSSRAGRDGCRTRAPRAATRDIRTAPDADARAVLPVVPAQGQGSAPGDASSLMAPAHRRGRRWEKDCAAAPGNVSRRPRRDPPDRRPFGPCGTASARRMHRSDYLRSASPRSARRRSSSQARHSAVTVSRKPCTLAAIASRSSISIA